MAKIIVCDNDKKMTIPINDNGNLLLSSLKTHFPSADSLTYEDDEGNMKNLTVDSEEVLLKANVKQYNVHHLNEAILQTASDIGKTLALESIGEDVNTENAPTNGTGEKCNEEDKSQEKQVVVDKPITKRNIEKTLRIGWLNKAAGDARYRKVTKPRGGVKKLKLDATGYYSACQIRQMAIDAFEASNKDHNGAIEEKFVVNLGGYGGQVISDFKRRDGQVCDIWDYCKDRGKTLYQLNLFMLTSPLDEENEQDDEKSSGCRTISTRRTKARPRIVNDLRVLYQYVRTSRYSGELSYMECDKIEIHSRIFDDQYGDCPPIERFEPLDYGYAISRIVKSKRVLLQIAIDDDGGKSTEFPSTSCSSHEKHDILYDVDQLQGYCNRKFGIGFVPSCSYDCRPVFTWYKDDQFFKSHEYLYWLDDVKDDESHLWSCTVSCTATGRQIKSKQVSIEAF